MKLAFSTKGWPGKSLNDFFHAAKMLGYAGVELHDGEKMAHPDGQNPLSKACAAATSRLAADEGVTLCCLDSLCDLTAPNAAGCGAQELSATLERARALRIPYVRVHALTPADDETLRAVLEPAVVQAERAGVTLLLETVGVFADTKRLKAVLSAFASDALAALYDAQYPFRVAHETPEETVKNLGAFIRHVHLRDSRETAGGFTPCLLCEGTLPVSDIMDALRSINFDGFIALEWDAAWMPEMTDMEVILTHFAARMSAFSDPSRLRTPLYRNRAGTGRYVWKKDALIDCTFSQVLDRMCEEFPDQPAFRYTTLDYTRTYSGFRDDVDAFARALISLGVRAGSHVAVWATNLPEWYISFWAAVKLGAVLVTMNTAYKIHEAEYLLAQSDAHTLIMIDGYRDSDYSSIISELCPELAGVTPGAPLHAKRLPFLRNVITVGFEKPGCLTFRQALARAPLVPADELKRMAARVDKSDVANMQYTSGTTGFPKGVMLTHYNIVNNGKCIGDRMDLSTADRMMVQVPMFHCFGMVLAMTATMTHGGTLYPLPYFSPRPALACIDREKITAFHGVPTMFIAMLENEDFQKTDFSHMRTGIMAGSPCPVKVMQDVVDKMHMTEITIVYGQTEASPGCTMSETSDPLEVRVNTVGRALPEIECRIVDPETGAELPDNVTGEFVARGYNIMKGYYKMPKATSSAIDRDGWLHTGDLAQRTPEGNYRITGRLKDMIIRGGENIYPKEIEEFIYTNDKVKDVQVIGVPDEQYGEEIMACVILKAGAQMTAEEMQKFVADHMARHKVPRYVDFVDEFPMNVAGKILKYQMRQDAIKKLGLEKAAKITTA